MVSAIILHLFVFIDTVETQNIISELEKVLEEDKAKLKTLGEHLEQEIAEKRATQDKLNAQEDKIQDLEEQLKAAKLQLTHEKDGREKDREKSGADSKTLKELEDKLKRSEEANKANEHDKVCALARIQNKIGKKR